MKLSTLPPEAKLLIVKYLSVRDYLNLAQTSHYWSNFIENNSKYLPKWQVDEFSIRCLEDAREGYECEAVFRGRPTKIKVSVRSGKMKSEF